MLCEVEYKAVKNVTETISNGNTSTGPWKDDTCPPKNCKCNVDVQEKKTEEQEYYEYAGITSDGCLACGKEANDSSLIGSTIPIDPAPRTTKYNLSKTSTAKCCKPIVGTALNMISTDSNTNPTNKPPKKKIVRLRCI
jgi:hypothetical protein